MRTSVFHHPRFQITGPPQRLLHNLPANQFYEDNQCRHESSAPYQQWQNAVERDIQTILSNVSATIHGQDFLRTDIWAHALTH